MLLSELENNSESVWVKVFANKTSHYVASWYRPPGGSSKDFQLFRDQLDQIRNKHKDNKFPSVHVLQISALLKMRPLFMFYRTRRY